MSSNQAQHTPPVTHERQPLSTSADSHEQEPKNLVQWGPIIAGVITTVAVMLLLTVLGLATGASVLEPREAGEGVGTAASIWGAVSAIIAFFIGGLVAARSASVIGGGAALLNGFLVAAAVMLLVLYMIGAGLGNLFGTVGNNIGDIANVAQNQTTVQEMTQEDVEQAADDVMDEATAVADDAFDTAEGAAWGTFAGLVLVHAAAAVGGLVGSNSRGDIRRRAPDAAVT